MTLKNRFWGSSTALAIGVLSVVAGLSLAGQGQTNENVEAGIGIVVGALAYRSLKKRLIGLKSTAISTLIYEYVCLTIAALILLLGFANGQLWYENPFAFVVVPVWAIGAYFVTANAYKKEV